MNQFKICTKCKESKALSEYYLDLRHNTPRPQCKVCYTASTSEHTKKNRERYTQYKRNWDMLNSEKVHNKNLMHKYGITIQIYYEMLSEQGGLCAICNGQSTKKTFDVDHCHKTGKVRGLLCSKCNRGIGFLQDNPLLLTKASLYLLK